MIDTEALSFMRKNLKKEQVKSDVSWCLEKTSLSSERDSGIILEVFPSKKDN